MAKHLDNEPIEIPGVGRRRRQMALASLAFLAGVGVLGIRVANSHSATFRPAATASQAESVAERRLRDIPPPPDVPSETEEPAAADTVGLPVETPTPASHGGLVARAPEPANAPKAAGRAQAMVVARPAAPPSPVTRTASPPVAAAAPKEGIIHDTPF